MRGSRFQAGYFNFHAAALAWKSVRAEWCDKVNFVWNCMEQHGMSWDLALNHIQSYGSVQQDCTQLHETNVAPAHGMSFGIVTRDGLVCGTFLLEQRPGNSASDTPSQEHGSYLLNRELVS